MPVGIIAYVSEETGIKEYDAFSMLITAEIVQQLKDEYDEEYDHSGRPEWEESHSEMLLRAAEVGRAYVNLHAAWPSDFRDAFINENGFNSVDAADAAFYD
ncbi:MAG: hypothetical protein ACRDL7_01780, partial [Gaiellaceae bacterium]